MPRPLSKLTNKQALERSSVYNRQEEGKKKRRKMEDKTELNRTHFEYVLPGHILVSPSNLHTSSQVTDFS